jgi:SAM-dependent methyltransferase/uncharacterized protein with ATP-grasp and redox domains
MAPEIWRVGDLRCLDDRAIGRHLKDFVGDDSQGASSGSIVARADFCPDSFTIQERLSNPAFLAICERDSESFLRSHVEAEITLLQESEQIALADLDASIDLIAAQVSKLMAYRVHNGPLAEQVYNQELVDVVRKVIAYCLYGDPNRQVYSFKRINGLAAEIVRVLIERHLADGSDAKELLSFSIASGLIGLDLKGTGAAASSFTHRGIALGPLLGSGMDLIADSVYDELCKAVAAGLAIDHWNSLIHDISSTATYSLVWLTDDFIETMFDLLLIQRMLLMYPSLRVSLVPKNGQHGNDASYADVERMLCLPTFDQLCSFLTTERLRVLDCGPRMGTVNAMKLAPQVVDEIRLCDAVHVKGCRSHEMIQGGINATTYTSFVVTREFTETETGLDARDTPLAFFRTEPGEYAFWGFKGRETRRKTFPDGREIPVCLSTLEEHEMRRTTTEPAALLADLEQLVDLWPLALREYRTPYDEETRLVVDRLCAMVRAAYDSTAERYGEARGREPDQRDVALMTELLEMARSRVREGKLGDETGKIHLLDVGTGHGRDLCYLGQLDDVRPVGIDSARGFIRILDGLSARGRIPGDSYFAMDMRKLEFGDATFDIVRHNATLLHLPLLPNRVGVDEAVAESFRVLKPSGLLYVIVKNGTGLRIDDTWEGLGGRIFQYFAMESLVSLLERNGFRILRTGNQYSQRPSGRIEWHVVFAEKPGTPANGEIPFR